MGRINIRAWLIRISLIGRETNTKKPFEEVDAKLKNIMVNIYHNIDDAAKRYGMEGNYVAGANIAGFEKVVNAMLAQGVC